MKTLRLITLITVGVASIAMAIIAPQYVHEYASAVILVVGMSAGALGMLLIILSEYVFPEGLHFKWHKDSSRSIRIL
jgi:hypothetical protein